MKTEKELAAELGIDRKILSGWRKDGIVATSSWVKVSNQIVYHEEGEHEVRNILQREICAKELSEPLPPPDGPQELVITKLPLNPRMVICGDRKVKVRDNKNFIVGMKVNARPSRDGEHIWIIAGRGPRWRGRY